MQQELMVKPLLFLDVKTTGTDPLIHKISQVSALLVGPQTLEVLDSFHSVIKLDESATGLDLQSTMVKLWPMFNQAIVLGHRVYLDMAFIMRAVDECKMTNLPIATFHYVDMASLAWPLLRKNKISDLSLDALSTFFDVKLPDSHTNNNERCLIIYRHLMAYFNWFPRSSTRI